MKGLWYDSRVVQPTFLLSIDLEDIRMLIPDGERYAERVPENTGRILDFLAAHDVRCTFFTTGDVARRYPELVKKVAEYGHEIACHSSDHVPIDRHTPESFRDDLKHCVDDLMNAGAERVVGYRAPMGSLTLKTSWAWGVMRDLGFVYSSSVTAAPTPLYGFPEYGKDRLTLQDGLVELPPSLSRLPGLNLPFMGGVYFRVLPFPLVRWLFKRRLAAGEPVVAYLHPYDVDTEQERFMHPELNDNRFYNHLMYMNRSAVFPRLERLLASGARTLPMLDYIEETLKGNP